MGEALSDFLVTRFAPVPTVLITAVLFAVILIVQLRADRYRPWLYWGTVSMVGVFGTMVADVTHVALGVPLRGVDARVPRRARRRLCLVASRRGNGRRAHHHQHPRQLFYWAAVITTFAMGTAAGDLAASTFHLGYLSGGLVFVAAMIVVVLARATAVLGPVTAFWTAYVLTRPIGASFADYIAVPHSRRPRRGHRTRQRGPPHCHCHCLHGELEELDAASTIRRNCPLIHQLPGRGHDTKRRQKDDTKRSCSHDWSRGCSR